MFNGCACGCLYCSTQVNINCVKSCPETESVKLIMISSCYFHWKRWEFLELRRYIKRIEVINIFQRNKWIEPPQSSYCTNEPSRSSYLWVNNLTTPEQPNLSTNAPYNLTANEPPNHAPKLPAYEPPDLSITEPSVRSFHKWGSMFLLWNRLPRLDEPP
jgi:hypothetical protein